MKTKGANQELLVIIYHHFCNLSKFLNSRETIKGEKFQNQNPWSIIRACSGSFVRGWAGIASKYSYANNEMRDSSKKYKCPAQPKVQLPTSKLWDGICDCLVRSDKSHSNENFTASSCGNTCDQILKENGYNNNSNSQISHKDSYTVAWYLRNFRKFWTKPWINFKYSTKAWGKLIRLWKKRWNPSQSISLWNGWRKQLLFSTIPNSLPFLNALSMEEIYAVVFTVCYVSAGHEKRKNSIDYFKCVQHAGQSPVTHHPVP